MDRRDSRMVGAAKGGTMEGCQAGGSGLLDFIDGEGKPCLSAPSTEKVVARGILGDNLSSLSEPEAL